MMPVQGCEVTLATTHLRTDEDSKDSERRWKEFDLLPFFSDLRAQGVNKKDEDAGTVTGLGSGFYCYCY